MKRLLIGPAIALASFGALFGCSGPKVPEAPKVPREIPIDNFEQRFPPIPHTPPAVLPEPVRKPVVRRASSADRHKPAPHKEKPDATSPTARPHVRHPAGPVGPLRAPAESRVGEAVPDQTLPAQQGVICIFPFSLIPSCTPGVP